MANSEQLLQAILSVLGGGAQSYTQIKSEERQREFEAAERQSTQTWESREKAADRMARMAEIDRTIQGNKDLQLMQQNSAYELELMRTQAAGDVALLQSLTERYINTQRMQVEILGMQNQWDIETMKRAWDETKTNLLLASDDRQMKTTIAAALIQQGKEPPMDFNTLDQKTSPYAGMSEIEGSILNSGIRLLRGLQAEGAATPLAISKIVGDVDAQLKTVQGSGPELPGQRYWKAYKANSGMPTESLSGPSGLMQASESGIPVRGWPFMNTASFSGLAGVGPVGRMAIGGAALPDILMRMITGGASGRSLAGADPRAYIEALRGLEGPVPPMER